MVLYGVVRSGLINITFTSLHNIEDEFNVADPFKIYESTGMLQGKKEN